MQPTVLWLSMERIWSLSRLVGDYQRTCWGALGLVHYTKHQWNTLYQLAACTKPVLSQGLEARWNERRSLLQPANAAEKTYRSPVKENGSTQGSGNLLHLLSLSLEQLWAVLLHEGQVGFGPQKVSSSGTTNNEPRWKRTDLAKQGNPKSTA